jgi:hypothetical protein
MSSLQRLKFSKSPKSMSLALKRFNREYHRRNGVSLYRLASGEIALDITHKPNKGKHAKSKRQHARSSKHSRK